MTIFVVLMLLISAGTSFGVAALALRKRRLPGAPPLALLGGAAGAWALCHLLELASASVETRLFWASLKYIPIVLIPLALAAFVLRLSGWTDWPGRRWGWLLLVVPLISLLGVWSNPIHGLWWTFVGLQGNPPAWTTHHGPWFWLHTTYSYTLMAASVGVAFYSLSRSPQVYHRRNLLLALSLCIPLVTNLLNLAGLRPIAGVDLSPMAFGLSAVLLLFTTSIGSLLDVVPLAYASLVQQMRDGVLVLSLDNRVMEMNRAAERALGLERKALLGRHLWESGVPALDVLRLHANTDTLQREIALGSEGSRCWYELHVYPLKGPDGSLAGRMTVWHEITDRKQLEDELRYASTHDPLTSLYNRLYYDEMVQRLAAGQEWPVTVLMIDLDKLKWINDHCGHAAGDEIIIRAAELIRSSLRSSDIVARIGGDEFAVLLPGCDEQVSARLIARLMEMVADYNAAHPEQEIFFSLGSALAHTAAALETALQQADQQMYAEKVRHKNGE